jgi:hypothetical protein
LQIFSIGFQMASNRLALRMLSTGWADVRENA